MLMKPFWAELVQPQLPVMLVASKTEMNAQLSFLGVKIVY